MNDCKQIFALLSEYIDGELPPDICSRLEAHIEDCGPCVEFVQSLKKSIAMCHKFEAGEKPEPLPDAVKQGLRETWERMRTQMG